MYENCRRERLSQTEVDEAGSSLRRESEVARRARATSVTVVVNEKEEYLKERIASLWFANQALLQKESVSVSQYLLILMVATTMADPAGPTLAPFAKTTFTRTICGGQSKNTSCWNANSTRAKSPSTYWSNGFMGQTQSHWRPPWSLQPPHCRHQPQGRMRAGILGRKAPRFTAPSASGWETLSGPYWRTDTVTAQRHCKVQPDANHYPETERIKQMNGDLDVKLASSIQRIESSEEWYKARKANKDAAVERVAERAKNRAKKKQKEAKKRERLKEKKRLTKPLRYMCDAFGFSVEADIGTTFSRCGGPCDTDKKLYYCSKQCQKADWKNHEPLCRSRAERSVINGKYGALATSPSSCKSSTCMTGASQDVGWEDGRA
ncbi:hypothetical protein BKA70DRAFT_1518350 [Coprinopsis sp. MPI-PUGE-AT-0042]|nr:hypothetical protein BKA70DRAFT_1518350 [Coprinopsis sp. MPI-PUGE-AT-0042]